MEGLSSSFDVLIMGTALPNSILAAALCRGGKSVLHLDVKDYYGEEWATMDGRTLDVGAIVGGRDLFNGLAVSEHRKFAVDAMPKIVYGSGGMVDLLVRSGVGRYLQFKCLQSALVQLPKQNEWVRVPASKGDIFQSDAISLVQKRLLMKFLMAFQQQPEALLAEWGEKPFVQLLDHHQIQGTLRDIVWHALCGSPEEGATVASVHRVVTRYLGSVNKFGKTPFLYPLYGCSESSQAFCRLAAVHGCTYMLRFPLKSVEEAAADHAPQSRFLVNGGEFTADWIVASPNYAEQLKTPVDVVVGGGGGGDVTHLAVCWFAAGPPPFAAVASSSEPGGDEPCLLHLRWILEAGVVQGLQLDSSCHVCPDGSFLVYLWSASVDALDQVIPKDASSSSSMVLMRSTQRARRVVPTNDHVLWCSDPQLLLDDDYESAIADAERAFRIIMGPDVEFLPPPSPSQQDNEDGDNL